MCIDPKDIKLHMIVEQSLRNELRGMLKTYPALLIKYNSKSLSFKEGTLINRLLKKEYFIIESANRFFPWRTLLADDY